MKRNPLDKSKCVVERRPIDGDDDIVKVLPITAKNASAVPVLPFIAGERISIICSEDEDDLNLDEDDGLIRSRPILMPFGMRPPMRMQPFNPMGGLPLSSMSVIGPIPLMMNAGQMMNAGNMMNHGPMMPSRSMSPPLPLNLTPPPFNLNNALLMEQRSFNAPPPSTPMRSPFQSFPAGQPFRFPENFNRQMRPLGPLTPIQRPVPFPNQFQPFQQPQRLFSGPTIAENRFNLPSETIPDNSQEKSHVPEHRMNSETELPITTPSSRTPIFRERQPMNPFLPEFPEGLLSLLDDLPGLLGTEKIQPTERLSIQPGQQNMPVFRLPKFLLSTPRPLEVSTTEIPTGPVQLPARPVTLPFLQVPPFPAALAKERSAPIPVNIPFPSVRNQAVNPPTSPAAPERRQGRASFFERLMDSILSTGNNKGPTKMEKSSSDSMPLETRALPPIRTGGRGLRMPEDGALSDGIIVARPIAVEGEAIAPEQDRRARSHCKSFLLKILKIKIKT